MARFEEQGYQAYPSNDISMSLEQPLYAKECNTCQVFLSCHAKQMLCYVIVVVALVGDLDVHLVQQDTINMGAELIKPYKAHTPVQLSAFQRFMKGPFLDAMQLSKFDKQVYLGNLQEYGRQLSDLTFAAY